MVMAAGLGTRLRPFSDLSPKPLMPLMGVPIVQFCLDQLAAVGVRNVVINVHHQPEKMRRGLAQLESNGMEIVISDESRKLLGSAGGIRKALDQLDGGPFFLLNSDVVSSIALDRLATAHRALRASWGTSLTLAVFPESPGAGAYREVFVDPATRLIGALGEKKVGVPFFASIAVIEPDAIRGLPLEEPADLVTAVLLPAIREQKAGAFVTTAEWHDIGSPELWLEAHVSMIRGLESGRMPLLWRQRLESLNHRIGPEIWVPRTASSRLIRGLIEWAGPSYWSPHGDPKALPPRRLGPRAAGYGPAPGLFGGSGVFLDGMFAELRG